jgi:4'-phosphopantetheinyl transferase
VYRVNFITKRSAFSSVLQTIGRLNGRAPAFSGPVTPVATDPQNEGQEIVPGVRIWHVAHNANSNLEDLETVLTKADLEEFASVRHMGVRQRSLATRAALRKALSEAVAGRVLPEAWRFERTVNGQPILSSSENNLKFSCSHTARMSVIAISTVGDVGIDIADAVLDFGSDWLKDVMSGQELKALGKLPENRLGGEVSRLWTLKEAYVKMLGTGIAEVGDVAFDLSDDRLLSGGSNDRFVQPVFRTWIVANQGHRYSVALASSRSVVSRTPLSCRLSEGPRVNSRDEFPILAG